MLEQTIDTLKLLLFENLSPYTRLFHAVSTRIGGVSPQPFHSLNLGIGTDDTQRNVLQNYTLLSRALQFDLQSVVTSHQVHQADIARVYTVPRRSRPFPQAHALSGYDAFITAQPGIALMVRVADCVPVILYAPDRNVLALVHAGWRGTLAGITKKTVGNMVREWGCAAENIRAGIGPAIGPCCFSVQQDVGAQFHSQCANALSFMREKQGGIAIDLPEANRLQLLGAGCRHDHIELSGLCTACTLNLFFSHRGEKGKTGRFALIAGLRS
jgi:YfiH family protein